MNAASNRETVKAGNTSRPNSFGSSKSSDHNFEAQQQQQLPPKEAPVFHNTQRRKGSIERRMLLKGGLKRHTADGVLSKKYSGDNDNIGDNDDDMSASITASTLRRNSTGTNSRFAKQAHHDSMDSLASFASFATFGSGTSGNSGEGEAVGNLTFVTDVEMLSIMYENDDDGNNDNNNVDSRNSTATYNSLPPSAILGKGATSMVRLAWRKSNKPNNNSSKRASSLDTNSDTEDNEAAAAAAMKITPDLKAIAARNEYRPTGQKAKSRRSVIRVISQPSIDNRSISSSKGDLVAVKLIQKSVLKQMKTMTRDSASNRVTVSTAFDNIEREIAMMKRLRHPNLVQLFEVIDSVESDKLYMVLEYVSLGEILSHVEGTDTYRRMRYKSKVKGLTPGGYFDEDNAALYFVDIMHGLAYLHRHGICHRDLKPENILLNANGIAKISDFGVAHVFDNEKDDAIRDSLMMSVCSGMDGLDFLDDSVRSDGISLKDDSQFLSRRESDQAREMPSQHTSGILNKTEGTWYYWSPEMCTTSEFSGYACDIWAAGICLFIFTTGKVPFFSMTPLTLFELISKAEVPYDSHPNMSNTLKGLLTKMLTKNPADRAGVGFCLQHEFCEKARIQRVEELGQDFEHSDQEIILTSEEVDTAFSVTKLSSLFEKKTRRQSNDSDIEEGENEGEDEEDEQENPILPPTFKPGTSEDKVPQPTNESQKRGKRRMSKRIFNKHFSESEVGKRSRKSKEKCVIQ